MDIREHETVETLSPIRRKQRLVLRRLAAIACLAAVVAALAVALVPPLRHRLLGAHAGPVTLAIESSPSGADVFLDEEHVGTTPTTATARPGQHSVRIVHDGYKPWRRRVDPSRTPKLAPTLQPLQLATLIVESTPDGAQVFLDGESHDTTPVTIRNVEAGSHTLHIERKPLYRAVTQTVQLQAGHTRRVVVRLESDLQKHYQQRIKEQPTKLANYTELVHVHLLNQHSAEAVEVVARGLKVIEQHGATPEELRRFYGELADVYRGKAGAIDQATQQKLLDAVALLFERLASANPAEPEYYQPLVMLLGRAEQWQAIVKVCSATAKVPEARGIVHVNVARMYLEWDEPKCAIMLLEPAAKLRPDYWRAHYYLGSAYRQAERPDEALRAYLAAEKLGTSSSSSSYYYRGLIHTAIARLLADKGDVDGAIARYKKAVEQKTSSFYTCQWRLSFAAFLIKHDRKAEAIEQYRAIHRISPDSKYGRIARKALHRLGAR